MQTLTLTIPDDFMPTFMKFIAGFNSREIKIEQNSVHPTVKKRDLSKLVAHDNVVDGDLEDLVHMNWEHEINVDFPK